MCPSDPATCTLYLHITRLNLIFQITSIVHIPFLGFLKRHSILLFLVLIFIPASSQATKNYQMHIESFVQKRQVVQNFCKKQTVYLEAYTVTPSLTRLLLSIQFV